MKRGHNFGILPMACSVLLVLSCLGGPVMAVASEETEQSAEQPTEQPAEQSTEQPTEQATEQQPLTEVQEDDSPVPDSVETSQDVATEEPHSEAPDSVETPLTDAQDAVQDDNPDTDNTETPQDVVLHAQSEHPEVITSIEAVYMSGSGPAINVAWSDAFRLNATFSLPDGQVYAGDTTTIQLPNELMFYQTASFPITNSEGDVIANAIIDGAVKTLTLVYTDYPETHSGVSGDFHFYVRVDHNVVTEEQDIDLRFDVGGLVVYGGTIHSGAPTTPSSPSLTKSGWQEQNDASNVFRHSVAINRQGIDIPNAAFTDEIQTSDTYIQSTLRVRKGNWVLDGTSWRLANQTDVTAEVAVEWGSDNRSFSISFGDIAVDEGYEISYATQCTHTPVDGEVFVNNATLTGNGTVIRTVRSTATHFEAGGSGEGYIYTIQLHKEDTEGQPLAGAVFSVIRESTGSSVGTITTDAEGEGSITGLLRDSYRLVEVTAPEGYRLLDEPIVIEVGFFNDDKIAVVRVENEPLVTEPEPPVVQDPEPPTQPGVDNPKPTTPTTPSVVSPKNAFPKTGDSLLAVKLALITAVMGIVALLIAMRRRNGDGL